MTWTTLRLGRRRGTSQRIRWSAFIIGGCASIVAALDAAADGFVSERGIAPPVRWYNVRMAEVAVFDTNETTLDLGPARSVDVVRALRPGDCVAPDFGALADQLHR